MVAPKKDSSRAREDFRTAVKSMQKILQSGEKNEQYVEQTAMKVQVSKFENRSTNREQLKIQHKKVSWSKGVRG